MNAGGASASGMKITSVRHAWCRHGRSLRQSLDAECGGLSDEQVRDLVGYLASPVQVPLDGR